MQPLPAGPVTSFPLIARPRPETLERLEAQITELWGHLTAATYRFLTLVAEFDRNEAYARHGLPSTAHWLNWQCGIGMIAARAKVRVARALEHLPEVSAGFASGEFSYSKVRAITRVATPANESVLASIARHGTASHVEKLVRKYRWTQRRDAEKNAQSQHLNRCVHYFYDENGTFVLNARLPPEIGAIVAKALQAAGDVLRESRTARCATNCELAPHGESTMPWSALSTARSAEPGRRATSRRRGVSRDALRRGRIDVERRPFPGRRARGPSRAGEADRRGRQRAAPLGARRGPRARARDGAPPLLRRHGRRHPRGPRRRAAQHRPEVARDPAGDQARAARAGRRLPLPGL